MVYMIKYTYGLMLTKLYYKSIQAKSWTAQQRLVEVFHIELKQNLWNRFFWGGGDTVQWKPHLRFHVGLVMDKYDWKLELPKNLWIAKSQSVKEFMGYTEMSIYDPI
jgi:hypothetical protein